MSQASTAGAKGGDDFVILTRIVSPIEAQILAARLQAEGVPAKCADLHLVQTHSLLTLALGGVRIMVPEHRLPDARALLARVEAGEFALSDDFVEGDLSGDQIT